MISSIQRTIPEIESYAKRLHRADPACTELIPVSPEEAFALQEDHLGRTTITDRNCFQVEGVRILGHRIKIL